MSHTTYFSGNTIMHRLDPRARVLASFAFAGVVTTCTSLTALLIAVMMGATSTLMARIATRPLLKRLARINTFVAVVLLVGPAMTPGRPIFSLCGCDFTYEGLHWGLVILLKANAIVLAFTAFIGTIEPFTLGYALHRLHIPDKLTHLLMFTVRYLDVLHHEYDALVRAMKVRGFQPAMNVHTYRSYANLTAMVLVRSLERSERIVAAMKCRGFTGEFRVQQQPAFANRDAILAVISCIACGVLLAVDCHVRGGL